MVYGDGYVQALTAAGRYDEAIAFSKAGLRPDSNQTENLYWSGIGIAELAKGNYQAALPALERQIKVRGLAAGDYAYAWAMAGQANEARRRLGLLLNGSP